VIPKVRALGVTAIVALALRAGAQSPPGASTLPPARDVIRRHVAAIGGEAALAKLNSRYVWGSYERPARRLKGTVELYAARPGRRLIKIQYPDVGAETTVFDGTNAWTINAGGTPRLLDRRQLPQQRDESVFDIDLHADSLFSVIETVRETDFEGRRCVMLHLVSTTRREWWEFYDVKTGLFAGSNVQRETDKEPVTVRTVVTEYGSWDGIRLPKTIHIYAAGVLDIVRVIDVKHNAVSDAVFEMPAKLRK
jgi:hypothetical protein